MLRKIQMLFLAEQPGVAYLTDPFTLRLDQVNIEPVYEDQLKYNFHQNINEFNLDVRAGLTYTWRRRQLVGLYQLEDRTLTRNSSGQREGSAVRANLYANHVNINWSTVTTLRGFASRSTSESNLVGVDGQNCYWNFGGVLDVMLPDISVLRPFLVFSHTAQLVSGVIDAKRSISEVGIQLRYHQNAWIALAKASTGYVRANDIRANTFNYGELYLGYDTGAEKEGIVLGLRVNNLAFSKSIRTVSYVDPLLTNQKLTAVPTTVVLEVRIPFEMNISKGSNNL